MYSVVRHYTNAAALGAALVKFEPEVHQLLSTVPGFVSYAAMPQNADVTTITMCQDRSGTEESSRRASGWVAEHLPSESNLKPEITEGKTFIQFAE